MERLRMLLIRTAAMIAASTAVMCCGKTPVVPDEELLQTWDFLSGDIFPVIGHAADPVYGLSFSFKADGSMTETALTEGRDGRLRETTREAAYMKSGCKIDVLVDGYHRNTMTLRRLSHDSMSVSTEDGMAVFVSNTSKDLDIMGAWRTPAESVWAGCGYELWTFGQDSVIHASFMTAPRPYGNQTTRTYAWRASEGLITLSANGKERSLNVPLYNKRYLFLDSILEKED